MPMHENNYLVADSGSGGSAKSVSRNHGGSSGKFGSIDPISDYGYVPPGFSANDVYNDLLAELDAYTGKSVARGYDALSSAVAASGMDLPIGIGVNGIDRDSVASNASKIVSDVLSTGRNVIDKVFGSLSGFGSSLASGYGSIGKAMTDSAFLQAQSNNDLMDMIQRTTDANNAWSAAEAQRNRDWQTWMSGTAHQREVADLQAAGLNPVLSASSSGAPVGSGAVAQPDTSNTRLMAEVAMQAIEAAQLSADALGRVSVSNTSDSLLGKVLNSRVGRKVADTAATTLTRYAIKALFG